jgi:hypothetical protein
MSTRINVTVEQDFGIEDIRVEVEHPLDGLPPALMQTMVQRAANAAQAYMDDPDEVMESSDEE